MIFDEIGLPEVVNFLQVNRRINSLGHKLLKQHQDLVKRYTTVCISPNSDTGPDSGFSYASNHPVDLLIEVADRPIIASCIKSVTLAEYDHSREVFALRSHAAAKLLAHQIFDRLRVDGRQYSAWFKYCVGVPITAIEVRELRQHGSANFQTGDCHGSIKASLGLLLMQLTHLRFLDCCDMQSALFSLTIGTHRLGESGVCLPSLPLEKIEFLQYDRQDLLKCPAPKLVNGVDGTLTVRLGSPLGHIDWFCHLRKLLSTGPGLREVSFVRGLPSSSWLSHTIPSAHGILIRYRQARQDSSYCDPWLLGTQKVETVEEIYNYLAMDEQAYLHRNHRVVELHGIFPDQELRIVKRDDID